MAKRYQVVGALAAFTVTTDQGASKLTYYKGDMVPSGALQSEIDHHLDVNLIAETPEGEEIPAGTGPLGTETHRPPEGNALGEPVERSMAPRTVSPAAAAERTLPASAEPKGTEAEAEAGAETDARREAARAKLAALDGPPDGRQSKDVLVEYLVGKGYNRDAAEKADKADLVPLVKETADKQ